MLLSPTTSKPHAIVLTNGFLKKIEAKTAHGLIRGSERFSIVGIIDPESAGQDAGEVLDGIHRNIPVFATVADAVARLSDIQYCIIGVATHGGYLPADFLIVIEACIRQKISIVNGLHDFMTERPEMAALASEYGVELIDVRKPKKRSELHFWTGEIFQVDVPVIAVFGMDCAMGKRTTCRMIRQACEADELKAAMIYTGQTGWMQGGEYGFIFDSTLNDFISGEIEHAIVSCWRETKPDVILVEGQSALRNPNGPCGSEILVSGNARYVVLVHSPKRKYYDHLPEWGEIPSLASEIELIRLYGSEVIAVALNTELCTEEEAFAFQREYQASLQLPVLLPMQQGVAAIVPRIRSIIQRKNKDEN